ARGPVGRAAGDPGTTNTPATATLADRCVVLHRPLRTRVCAHGRPASSPHGTTNGQLVVQWRSGAPRQRRRPCPGPARRAEFADGGRGYLSFRSVNRVSRCFAWCAAVGGAARLRPSRGARLRPLCALTDIAAARGGAGIPRRDGRQPFAGAYLH